MIEFPDFDLEGFYMLAKRINDFLNNPDFEKCAEIITESMKCKTQVMTTLTAEKRLSKHRLTNLTNVLMR